MIGLLLAVLLPQDLFGDGVLDAAGETLYLIAPEGGIDVVDAATGKVRKHFEAKGRPVALAEGKLAVETREERSIALSLFDLDGKVLVGVPPVELPDWASTRPGTQGRSFSTRIRIEGSALHVDWFAGSHYPGGPAPPREVEAAHQKNASGRVSVDLRTHAVVQGPVPEEKVRTYVAATSGGRLEAGGRVYTVEVKQDREGGRIRNVRTLMSDAGWSRLLTPRYYAIPLPSAAPVR